MPAVTSSASGARHSHCGAPSAWVQRFAPLAPPGEVLDLACGSGRHARLFATRGHSVLAVDRDPTVLLALAALKDPNLSTLQLDLEDPTAAAEALDGGTWPLGKPRFAAIVVTNYLHRPLLQALAGSLAPGGILIYETFAVGNQNFGKPSNPDFLLRPGELLQLATSCKAGTLHVLAFEDLYTDTPAPAMVQRLCARRVAAVVL